MQTITITTGGVDHYEGNNAFTKSYYVISDNPPLTATNKYLKGTTTGGYFLFTVANGVRTYVSPYPWEIGVVGRAKNNFNITAEDTIVLDGVTIQESSLTLAQRAEAEIQRILAEQEAERQRHLTEQAQLQAKTAMLQSSTATWSSQEAYKAEVAETSAEIRDYNAEIAAVLATAPGQPGITDDALLRKPQAQSQPAAAPGSDGNAGKAIVIAVGLVAGIALLAIAGGRK